MTIDLMCGSIGVSAKQPEAVELAARHVFESVGVDAGYLASLHVNATIAPDVPFERLFIDLEASPFHDLVAARDGKVAVPDRPGLGRDPDMDVLRRYQLAEPTVHRG